MLWSMLPGLTLILVIAQGDAAATNQAEMKAIQGIWQAMSLEVGGQSAPAEFVAKGRYLFEKDQLTIYEGDDISGKAQFILHPEMNPKGIDLIAETPGKDKGKKVEGIYEIKDGTLKLCFAQSKRPTKFVSEGDTGVMTFQKPAPPK